MAARHYALAVDIGGTSIKFGLIDDQAELTGELVEYPVPFTESGSADPAALIRRMEPHVARAAEIVGQPVPIGISLCGNVDVATGEAVLVANLRWRGVPFSRLVQEHFGQPVYMATDVRQAALAEAIWGAGRGGANLVWVTVGTGYGGYLFLDGKLYGGRHGFAGNFGHTPLDAEDGYLCGCGQRGCIETHVAGPAIARAGQAVVDRGQPSLLHQLAQGGRVTARMVFRAVEAGDGAALAVIDRVIRLICLNLAGVVNLLDPDVLVFGGGVMRAAPWFIERIDREIRHYLMTDEAKRDLRVTHETFPNSALWGAAANVFCCQGVLSRDVFE